MKNILSIQSHVVFGYAGNKAATLPMQLLGVDVWPLNTVHFSNHTQYGKWTGTVTDNLTISELVEGINNIDQLKTCDAILTGYLGSSGQVEQIINIVSKIKQLNNKAIYLLDPVMGHKAKGCSVAPGVAEAIKEQAIKHADIITPNLLELEILTNREINTFNQVVDAMKELKKLGPKIVIIKHLETANLKENTFEMLMLNGDDLYYTSRPLYELKKRPVGVGDLIASMFLANIVNGLSPVEALKHVINATDAVMKKTSELQSYELQIVSSRKEIMNPSSNYNVEKL